MGGGGTRISPKSKHFVWFGKVDWGAGHKNHCTINAFVWFCKVGWGRGTRIIATLMHLYGLGKLVGAGHEKSLQHLCICKVLEGWLGGWGIRNHCKINTFVCFWKAGWGSGAPEIIATSTHVFGFGTLVGGGGGPRSTFQNNTTALVLQ